MSNREIVQDIYAAFAKGDIGSVLRTFHPAIVWMEAEHIPYADGNPYVGPQRVLEGVFGRIGSEWDGFSIRVESLVCEGERVVALGRYRGTFKATGRRLDAQFVHAWTLREGIVTRFQQYADTAQFQRVTQLASEPVVIPLADLPATTSAQQPLA